MCSILCPHPNSLRTKTSVEGVSVLQSRTTIHVTTIPNHEAVISFWGGNKGSTYMQLLLATCSLKLKNFVNMFVTFATYERELNQPRPTYKNKNKTYHIKTFYYDLYNAKPIRSTDWAVKENY